MALEDYIEPEVGVAVALTAMVASPKVRNVLRRGAVYGLAGVLMAGDAVSSLAQGVKRGVQQAAPSTETDAPPAPPVILSMDDAAAESPVVAGKYASVSTEESAAPTEDADDKAGASTPKKTRKTSEAASHE